MKVTALLCSPRVKGNTELLLDHALEGIREEGHEVKVFRPGGMDLSPCLNCGGCTDTGICVVKDRMGEIYDAIRSSDRIVLASPIYFFALSAQAKIMIDRCQAFWCEKYLLKKPIPPGPHGRKGLLLIVGAMHKEIGVECSEACAKAFFRTISVPEHRTLSFLGADAKGAILQHQDILDRAYEYGKELVSMA